MYLVDVLFYVTHPNNVSLLLKIVGEVGLEPHKHRHPLQLSNIAVNFLIRKQKYCRYTNSRIPRKMKTGVLLRQRV